MSAVNLSSTAEIEQFYHSHSHWLKNLFYKRLGNVFDAADLTQDVFIKLLTKPRSFDCAEGARAYLSTMAKGMCVDLWRRREIEKAWYEELSHFPEAVALSAEYHVTILETLCLVDNMLYTLPDKVRTAFIMSQLQGLTYAEIATQLNVSERMIKKYMAQAMLTCVIFMDEHDLV